MTYTVCQCDVRRRIIIRVNYTHVRALNTYTLYCETCNSSGDFFRTRIILLLSPSFVYSVVFTYLRGVHKSTTKPANNECTVISPPPPLRAQRVVCGNSAATTRRRRGKETSRDSRSKVRKVRVSISYEKTHTHTRAHRDDN